MSPKSKRSLIVKKKWSGRKSLFFILPIIVILGFGIYEAIDNTSFLHKSPALEKDKNTTRNDSTSSESSSNKKSNSSSTKTTQGGSASTIGQGVRQTAASDTNGQSGVDTAPGQWSTSASGVITLKSPTAHSTFKSGSIISGTAKVSKVWYRLVDRSSGVISQGNPLNVVNGKFSGVLNFHAYGGGGQLDVFSRDSEGREINEVSVPLNF